MYHNFVSGHHDFLQTEPKKKMSSDNKVSKYLKGWSTKRLEKLDVGELRRECQKRHIDIAVQAHKKTCITKLLEWKHNRGESKASVEILTQNMKKMDVHDPKAHLEKWTPKTETLLQFFNNTFNSGKYTVGIPNYTFRGDVATSDSVVQYKLHSAIVRKNKTIFFKVKEGTFNKEDWNGLIAPSQLLYPQSTISGPIIKLPPIAPDEWADERSEMFADLVKPFYGAQKKATKKATVVVLDGRGRNTVCLRKNKIKPKDIYNVEMDPTLCVWQQLHGLNAIYSNAILMRRKDKGFIENSILHQDKDQTGSLTNIYQNTCGIYFDFYGCKQELLEQVLENVDILLPKVRVIGIAQFTRRACEEIVTDIVLDESPAWFKIFDKTKRTMRCRFYVKNQYRTSESESKLENNSEDDSEKTTKEGKRPSRKRTQNVPLNIGGTKGKTY